MKVFQRLIIFLVLWTAGKTIAKAKVLEVSIGLKNPRGTTSDRFLSVTLDSSLLSKHWKGFDFSNKGVRNMAHGLAPAFLRIGGTEEDFLIFNPRNFNMRKEGEFTAHDWDSVNEFARSVEWNIIFGLNVLTRKPGHPWNASNALELLKYTRDHGYEVNWELGNVGKFQSGDFARLAKEINRSPKVKVSSFQLETWHLEPDLFYKTSPNNTIAPEALAKDFQTLYKIVNSMFNFRPLIVGPDVATLSRNHYFERFVNAIKQQDVLSAVSFHHYYLNGRTSHLQDFINATVLDKLFSYIEEANNITYPALGDDKIMWIGETSSAYGGGTPGVSDAFAAGFLWLDKLGVAALFNYSVLCRQDFYGGRYSLLNLDTLEPLPDYWLSLLYKRLVGPTVLRVKTNSTENPRNIRVYAHCTSTKYRERYAGSGAVTIMVLNLLQDATAELYLTGELSGLPVDQYLLSPPHGNLTSKSVLLNGDMLKLTDDQGLPELNPVTREQPIKVPPLTFGFFVVTAKSPACS